MKRNLLVPLTAIAVISLGIFIYLRSRVIAIPSDGENTVTVNFSSICCGPPSDSFLRDYVDNFQTIHHLTIPSEYVSTCGLEGDYKVVFGLDRLDQNSRDEFLTNLNTKVNEQCQIEASKISVKLRCQLQVRENTPVIEGSCNEKPRPW